MYAVAADGGIEEWTVATNNALASTPAVSDGIAYVPSGNKVLALSAATGSSEWANSDASGSVGPLTVTDGRILFAVASARVRSLDAASGEQQWVADLNRKCDSVRGPPTAPDRSPRVSEYFSAPGRKLRP